MARFSTLKIVLASFIISKKLKPFEVNVGNIKTWGLNSIKEVWVDIAKGLSYGCWVWWVAILKSGNDILFK